MNSTSRPNRINIDLQCYKQTWLDYCRENGITPSQGFRQVVAKLTAGKSSEAVVGESEVEEGAKIRKGVRQQTNEQLRGGEINRADALIPLSPSQKFLSAIA